MNRRPLKFGSLFKTPQKPRTKIIDGFLLEEGRSSTLTSVKRSRDFDEFKVFVSL